MSEGVVGVRLLTGHLKADEGDDGGTGIGQVVESVCGDGDGAAYGPCQKFCAKKDKIEQDTHKTAEDTVTLAHFGI